MISRKMTSYAIWGVLLIRLLACEVYATPPACPMGYTFAFFNGVGNTYADAVDGMNALQTLAFNNGANESPPMYNGEDVNFEPYYNHTGSVVGASVLQDVAEVFIQRAAELDPTGTWSKKHFYLFWDGVDSLAGTPGYTNTIAAKDDAFGVFYDHFLTAQLNKLLDVLEQFSSPPTLADYADHRAQLDVNVAAGRKLVMVAHSQGNLFVNQAYDYVQPQIGSNLVKVVHIAPASPTLRGNYELANIDLVINALRLRNGFATVPDVNLYMQSYGSDKTGHMLVPTYLDPSRPGLLKSQQLIADAFAAISVAPCPMTVTPASSQAKASQMIGLTASLTNPVLDPYAVVTYKWEVTGTANGTVKDPISGYIGTSFEGKSTTATYIASDNAVNTLQDTVTVTAYVTNQLDNAVPPTHKAIAMAVAAVGFGTATKISPSNPILALGDHQTFSAQVQPAAPPGATYRWTLSGDGSIGAAAVVTTTINSIAYAAPNAPGSATLALAVLDATGQEVGSDSTGITIAASNGCYNLSGFLAKPGGTYSTTLSDLGAPPNTQSLGATQTSYLAKPAAAFNNPNTASALEQDTNSTTTMVGSTGSTTQQEMDFDNVTATPDGLGSGVLYAITIGGTDSKGVASKVATVFNPPFVFAKNLLTPGQSVSIPYVGTETQTKGSSTTSSSFNFTEMWTFRGRQTITVPAGTYDTCEFEMYYTSQPNTVYNYWDLYRYGMRVQQTVTDMSTSPGTVVDTGKATAVTINGATF